MLDKSEIDAMLSCRFEHLGTSGDVLPSAKERIVVHSGDVGSGSAR